jgi:hypothetical protein
MMNDLLKFAVQAHGGLELWNNLKTINAGASITGAIWHVKSRPEVLKKVTFEMTTHKEMLKMTFPGTEKITVFEPKLITIRTNAAKEPEQWLDPKGAFNGHELSTPWQDVHVAYFSGEALWTYLTTPFLYTYPGFISEEIDPWYENGEVWRRLKVTFPENISSHTREQISYFGPDGLIRRHDYTVDILGGATGANYATNYQNINGLIVPATRLIYAYTGEEHKVVENPVLVSIEMESITTM